MTDPVNDPEYFPDYPEETEALRQIFEDVKTVYRLLQKIEAAAKPLRGYSAKRIWSHAEYAQNELSCGWDGLEKLFGEWDRD